MPNDFFAAPVKAISVFMPMNDSKCPSFPIASIVLRHSDLDSILYVSVVSADTLNLSAAKYLYTSVLTITKIAIDCMKKKIKLKYQNRKLSAVTCKSTTRDK